MAWAPILEGELADRACTVLAEIADDLATIEEPSPDLALFWTYLSNAHDDELTVQRGELAVDRFVRDLERGIPGIHLHGGLPGAGWVAAHISDELDDVLAQLDGLLLELLAAERWDETYDLIGGLVGLSVYFLARGDAPSVEPALRRIVHHLVATSEETADGVTWKTRPELIPEHRHARFPAGYYDHGVAHGVAGVISILARIGQRGIAADVVTSLRQRATHWLLAHQRDGSFPSISAGEAWVEGRSAWCYGDPGTTVALLDVALRTGEPTGAIDALIRRWADQPAIGICDGGVCHGTAGLAHMFNRMYQATGDETHRDHARAWFERTLEIRRPGEPLGGYPMFVNGTEHPLAQVIDGAAGVGLALLAAITAIEPRWDQLLLLDLPTR